MPCRYDTDEIDERLAARNGDDMPCTVDTRAEDERELKALTDERNALTRMLCELIKVVPASSAESVPGLIEWWNKHQESDAKRRARLKREALAKLTRDEREALGF